MIVIIVMVFIIFLCYEINVNNTRKFIAIFMAYPMLIKDGDNVENKKKRENYYLPASFKSYVCQQQLFFYNIMAQTIKKNMYVPYDVLEIIFVVTIYQKCEMFGFWIFSRFSLLFVLESNCFLLYQICRRHKKKQCIG